MMRTYFYLLVALLSVSACSVDDGDTAAPTYMDTDAQATPASSDIHFDGDLLTIVNPPLAEWAQLAGLAGYSPSVEPLPCMFATTELGYSSQTTIYRLQPDGCDQQGQPYRFRVSRGDDTHWIAPVFGADSELMVDHYSRTMTLALRLTAIVVDDSETTTLGSQGRLYIFIRDRID